MADEETIRTYDAKAQDYAKRFANEKPSGSLMRFTALLSPGARILDWGCGPATSSHHFRERGFEPDPVDASPQMVAMGRDRYGLNVRLGTFDEALPQENYHGVWANFSLLHAPRSDFPKHLRKLNDALLPDGILHLGMKTGTGEKRDHLGRFYTFYETLELTRHLETAGFKVLEKQEGEEAGLAGSVDPFVLLLGRKI